MHPIHPRREALRHALVMSAVVAVALPLELVLLGLNYAPGHGPDWLALVGLR